MNKQPQKKIEPRGRPGKSRHSKPDRRWTLLFIGDHGRVITLKRFKGIVFLSGLIFVLAVASIVLLFWNNQSIHRKNEELGSSLDLFQKRIQTLRHEKEILMARLVLAESRVKESIDNTPDNTPDTEPPKPLPADEPTEPSQKENTEVAAKKKQTAAALPSVTPQPAAEPPDDNSSVDVEDFNIVELSDPGKIKIQFKIKNTSPNSQRVSGHVIVVLKGDELKPKMWLSVPPMGLVDGKPTGKQRGHWFAINYFRTMRFTTNAPQSPHDYNKAAVYVYNGEGRLLLEQEFPAEIPVAEAAAPEPSSAAGTLPARKIGDLKQKSENPPTESENPQTEDDTSGTDERLLFY